MILILACIRLDPFCDRKSLYSPDTDKNPFNFLCEKQKYDKIKDFFKNLYESEDALPE
jgi:hypothetical protein